MSLQSFDNAIKMYPNDTLEARRYYSYVLKFFSLENLDTEIPLQDFLSIGNKLYILKDYRQAEKICASILEKHPDNQQAEKILSDILIELTSPGAKKNNHLLI